MNETNQVASAQSASSVKWAIISLICFAGMFASFSLTGKFEGAIYIILFFAVSSHLSLFPLIGRLAAPDWAKYCGYSWATIDIILSVATVHGAQMESIMQFRMGLHVVAAFWPLGAAMMNKGIIRWAGFLLAAAIGIIPLAGPALPPQAMYAAAPFILFWLLAIALEFRKRKE